MASNPKDAPRHFYTFEEYFALEHTGDARYEYWDGDIVCISGGSKEHARIDGNGYLTELVMPSSRSSQPNITMIPW